MVQTKGKVIMRQWLRLRLEVALIKLARVILIGRNVQRSDHVSRKDNNRMWYMAEELEAIESRMLDNYENN